MLVTRKGQEIKNLSELKGKKIATMFGTSYHAKFKEVGREIGSEFEYLFVETDNLSFQALEQNKADVAAGDAVRIIFDMSKYKNLSVCMPFSDVEHLGWAVEKNNDALAAILDKHLDFTRSSGLFDKYWIEDFGISINEYLRIVTYDSDDTDE